MKLLTAPEQNTFSLYPSVFLAGSIEIDTAVDWQQEVIKELEPLDVTVFNPRRKAWDASWKQDESNPHFVQQVQWEMSHLELATVPFFYFAPGTKSPISLLELGLVAGARNTTELLTGTGMQDQGPIVVCPEEFWRAGNVSIVCARYNIQLYRDLGYGILALKNRIHTLNDTRIKAAH